MGEFLTASIVSLGLILASAAIFYEVIAHLWLFLPKLEGRPRRQILLTLLTLFGAHTAVVWLFGLTFYGLEHEQGFGHLAGSIGQGMMDYVYFSSVTYSSLGLGDVYPTGGLRMLVGVEAIMGLILIGWTITFTYLVTEKYIAHREARHKRRR